jgi:hypothetical protein
MPHHPDNSSEIEKVRAYIVAVEGEVNRLKIVPRSLDQSVFDSVALAALSKIFALAKACLALLDADFPDEACGLSRSLVECAINLRYLTQDPALQDNRSTEFTKYAVADKSYWLHHALQGFSGWPEEQGIREHAQQMDIEPDTKAASRHWSATRSFVWTTTLGDHPLDGPTNTEPRRRVSYAVDYHHTSSFVHCAQPALDNYFPEQQNAFCITPSSGQYIQPSQKVLFIIVIYLHSAIAYALFGLGVGRPANINKEFGETLQAMKPPERLHQ